MFARGMNPHLLANSPSKEMTIKMTADWTLSQEGKLAVMHNANLASARAGS